MIFLKAVFASWIPEITELAAQRNKYGGKYNKDVRKRYTRESCTEIILFIHSLVPLFSFLFDSKTESISILLIMYAIKTFNYLLFL